MMTVVLKLAVIMAIINSVIIVTAIIKVIIMLATCQVIFPIIAEVKAIKLFLVFHL